MSYQSIRNWENLTCPHCQTKTLECKDNQEKRIKTFICSKCGYEEEICFGVRISIHPECSDYIDQKLYEIANNHFLQEKLAFSLCKFIIEIITKRRIIEIVSPSNKNIPCVDFKLDNVSFEIVKTNHRDLLDKSLKNIFETRVNEKLHNFIKLKKNGKIDNNHKAFLVVVDSITYMDGFKYANNYPKKLDHKEILSSFANAKKIVDNNYEHFHGLFFITNRKNILEGNTFQTNHLIQGFLRQKTISLSTPLEFAMYINKNNLLEEFCTYVDHHINELFSLSLINDYKWQIKKAFDIK